MTAQIQSTVKQWGKHIASVTLFAVLVIVFFSPSVLDGKTLRQMDNEKATGMGNSQMAPYEETAAKGEFSVWSDAMFSGMPYISGYGDAAPKLPGFTWLERPLKSIDYGTASMVFTGLTCFYILMYAMGMSWWLAIAGSIAFAFASYNIIIIDHQGLCDRLYASDIGRHGITVQTQLSMGCRTVSVGDRLFNQ